MTTDTVLQIGTDAVRAFSQQLNEPDWLTQIRLEALELAGKLELPILEKTRIDRWDLDHFGTFKQDEKIESLDKLPQQFQELITDGVQNMIVQRNASVIYNELSDELKQQGVIFTDLHTAAKEHADLVQKHLFQVVKKDEHRLAALHAALWSGGMFLYV